MLISESERPYRGGSLMICYGKGMLSRWMPTFDIRCAYYMMGPLLEMYRTAPSMALLYLRGMSRLGKNVNAWTQGKRGIRRNFERGQKEELVRPDSTLECSPTVGTWSARRRAAKVAPYR